MKRSFKFLIVIALLIVNSMTYIYADGKSVNDISIDATSKESTLAIEKILASIDDSERIEKIANLLGTLAYYEESSYEQDEFSNFDLEVEYYNSEAINAVNLVQRLATISETEMENEIKLLVEQLVKNNIDNSNIIWSKDFIDTYVKKYTPKYTSLLMDTNKSNVQQRPSMDSFSIAGISAQKKATHTITGTGLGGKLFTFKCDVTFGYDGTRVLSLYPTTVGTAIYPGVSYVGLVTKNCYEGFPFSDNNYTGLVTKEGHFRYTIPGAATLNYYPWIDIVVLGNGDWYAAGGISY